MRDLIARLEAAQGPDPELCALAVAAVVGGTVKRSPINGRWCIYVGTDHRGEPRLWGPRGAKWNEIKCALIDDRGPTASLDAALALFEVRPDTIPTDPIKATIAALRARLTMETSDADRR
jgi:hypothetical protein